MILGIKVRYESARLSKDLEYKVACIFTSLYNDSFVFLEAIFFRFYPDFSLYTASICTLIVRART